MYLTNHTHYPKSYNFQDPNYNNLPIYQKDKTTITQRPANSGRNDYGGSNSVGTSAFEDSIPRYADYGTEIVSSGNLAQNRGSGQFNPSPTYEQTTNRGPAYSQALNTYIGYEGDNNYYNYNNEVSDKAANSAASKMFATAQSSLDTAKKFPFQVGSSSFHVEGPNSWSKPTFENNTGTDKFQDWALKSTQMTPSALLMFFFSSDNVLYLQQALSDEVFRIRGIKINPQSLDEILIIMRNKYLYAIQGYLPMDDPSKVYARGTIQNQDDKEYSKAYGSKGPTSLINQVQRLNQSVLENLVAQTLGAADAYMQYYKDSSSLPLNLSHPVLTSMKGARALSEPVGLESGHEMTEASIAFNQRFNII